MEKKLTATRHATPAKNLLTVIASNKKLSYVANKGEVVDAGVVRRRTSASLSSYTAVDPECNVRRLLIP